jgi:hypothetical protein
MSELTEEGRDALLKALGDKLDTRDKRFMFLKLSFPKLLSNIQIEGSQKQTAWNIYDHFKKQCMLGSLMACMNSYLDCDLYLTLKEKV